MPAPPIVQNDRIMGMCTHVPAAVPPPTIVLPFSAPLTDGLVDSVKIAGRAAAVMGSSGKNMPPHAGINDPFTSPSMQVGTILSGSATVLIGGKPAATATSTATCCLPAPPGQLVPSVTTVLIG